jgi:hypothetical protein
MWGLIKTFFIPFTLAWAACSGLWNAMTDRGWNIYLRLVISGMVFMIVAVVCMWCWGYFSIPPDFLN